MDVGIRELKNRLSEYVARVRTGKEVTITDRGRPVALLRPLDAGSTADAVSDWVSRGIAAWHGGKPQGSRRPPRVAGDRAAAIVTEDRR
jgi:prevent-host-death family protein